MTNEFDLKKVIQNYNTKFNKKIRLTKTWGLLYLEPKQLALLNEGQTILEQAIYYEPYFIDRRHEIQALVEKAKQQRLTTSLSQFRYITQQLQEDSSIRYRVKWEEKTKAHLNNPKTWEAILKKIEGNPTSAQKVKQLKAWWETNQAFNLYSSQALLYTLHFSSGYQHHLEQALQELSRHEKSFFGRMPTEIAHAYRSHLNERKTYITTMRRQVMQAIITRLKVAEQSGNIACDDVTMTVVKQLQQLGMQSRYEPLPKFQATFDAQTFCQMHYAIEKEGGDEFKRQLYQLKWYQSNHASQATTEKIEIILLQNHKLLVPQCLKEYCPKRLLSPKWLFADTHARADFFIENQQLFASFASLSIDKPVDLTMLSLQSPHFCRLDTHYQLLQKVQSQALQQKIPWWQVGRRRLQREWGSLLNAQLQTTALQYFHWLQDLSNQITKSPAIQSNRTASLQLWLVAQRMSTLIQTNLLETHQKQLETLLDKLAVQLKLDPISQCVSILKTLSDNPVGVSQGERQYVITVLQQMRLRDEGFAKQHQITPAMTGYIQPICETLFPCVRLTLHHSNDLRDVYSDVGLLYELGDVTMLTKLQQAIDKMVIRQFNRIQTLAVAEAQKAAKQLMSFVQDFGSPSLQKLFQMLPLPDSALTWPSFLTHFSAIAENLTVRYTQAYIEKAYIKLQAQCDEQLAKITKNNPEQLAICQQLTEGLMANNQQQFDDKVTTAYQPFFNSFYQRDKRLIRSLIELKASLPFFTRKISESERLAEKAQWLDLLTATVHQKVPDLTPMICKRYM